MVPWTALYIHHRITVKELAHIVVSAIVWGAHGGEKRYCRGAIMLL